MLSNKVDELFTARRRTCNYIGRLPCERMHPPSTSRPTTRITAVDYLGEVLGVVQFDHFLVAEIRVTKITDTELWADLLGEPFDPTRHEISAEVKAVTYHQLKVARQDDKWVARVLLDI